MAEHFTWVPIYKEVARSLLDWQERQGELIAFLERLRGKGLKITPFTDQDSEGGRLLMSEIDPFTFFGVFNRGIRTEQRVAILTEIKSLFGLSAPLPSDFDGVPILNNQRSWFVAYASERKSSDVKRLWEVFKAALTDNPLDDPIFSKAFNEALEVKGTNLNLTIGLFWIRPGIFLNLDQTNRQFLSISLPIGGLSAEFYIKTVREIANRWSFPELSYEAWLHLSNHEGALTSKQSEPSDVAYWMVGAYWSDHDPPDLTHQFLDEAVWRNGYEDRYLEEVKSMRVGDRIAIKSSSTRRENLPFDARNNTVSYLQIKAIGTVVANRGDGRVIEVEWDTAFQPKTWYFYTHRGTVWRLRPEDPYAKRLIEFTFDNVPQDYEWFCQEWWDESGKKADLAPATAEFLEVQPYGIADIVASGVFAAESEIKQALDRLESKKNLILQGPPGTGKTFLARKLSYALMEARDDQRIEMIQFHQSYSYDDFVRGYRPVFDKPGSFGLKNGVFYNFCERARKDVDRRYVFIIDEINRGNLSQIFGECLMLIEADKRRQEYALPLAYNFPNEPHFFVPENVFLVGLMNVADRSLAFVDYALRRRFAFMTLQPEYGSERFKKWLSERNMNLMLVDLIIQRMSALNAIIRSDPLLGVNYEVGHSFFCPKGERLSDFSELDEAWYRSIIETEIVPLLREYWYDNIDRVEEARGRLLLP
jgi:5-methylcytosine-specific restriction enzyme B